MKALDGTEFDPRHSDVVGVPCGIGEDLILKSGRRGRGESRVLVPVGADAIVYSAVGTITGGVSDAVVQTSGSGADLDLGHHEACGIDDLISKGGRDAVIVIGRSP